MPPLQRLPSSSSSSSSSESSSEEMDVYPSSVVGPLNKSQYHARQQSPSIKKPISPSTKARRDRHRQTAISSYWSSTSSASSPCSSRREHESDDVDVDELSTVATAASTITSPSITACSLGSSKSCTGDSSSNISKVRFGSVQIREYSRILGDNLNVTDGPPLAIGWSFYQHGSKSLEDYEDTKKTSIKTNSAPKKMPKTNPNTRKQLLLKFDVSEAEINMQEKQVQIILKEQARQQKKAAAAENKGRFSRFIKGFSRGSGGANNSTTAAVPPAANPMTKPNSRAGSENNVAGPSSLLLNKSPTALIIAPAPSTVKPRINTATMALTSSSSYGQTVDV